MNWDRNILTDSGGYQVYSLSEVEKLKKKGLNLKSILMELSYVYARKCNGNTAYNWCRYYHGI